MANEITSTNGGVNLSINLPDGLFEGQDRDAVFSHEQRHADWTSEAFAELLAEFNACEGGVRCMASMVLAGACQEATEYIRAARAALGNGEIDSAVEDDSESDEGIGMAFIVVGGDFDGLFGPEADVAEPATASPVA